MKRYTYNHLAILTPFYLVSLFVLFMPLESSTASPLSPFDSFIHIGLFATLGILTLFAFPKKVQCIAWGLLIYASYSEIIQTFIPTRTPDLRDLLNDCIGISIALIIFAAFKTSIKKDSPRDRREQKSLLRVAASRIRDDAKYHRRLP